MTIVLVSMALLPGLALVGPLLIGRYFEVDWVLKAGLGFDVFAMILGAGAFWLVYSRPGSGSVGGRLLVYVGGGLVVFGLLFAAITGWLLYAEAH